MITNIKNPDFHSRLKDLVGSEKPFAWAAKCGISHGAFSRIWKEGTIPSPDLLIKISNATGVSLNWLLLGDEPIYRTAISEAIERRLDRAALGMKFFEDEFVVIPMRKGSPEAESVVPDDTLHMTVAFRIEWIKGKGDPKQMSVIRVEGDSMIPTLLSGDLVVVNHNIRKVAANGGIYAVNFRGDIALRRIEVLFPSGQLHIIPDNKEYGDSVIEPQEANISGRVISFIRNLEW